MCQPEKESIVETMKVERPVGAMLDKLRREGGIYGRVPMVQVVVTFVIAIPLYSVFFGVVFGG